MRTEFDFINNIKERFALRHVGDDCAVLPKDERTDQLITVDLLVEDIDFRLEWTAPQLLGHKSLAVSLSDIAAMGGTPKWAMLSIGVPEHVWNSDFLDAFYEGWGELAGRFGVELIGGDVSRTPDKIVIDSIASGEAERGKAVLRSGARAGDSIYVTGPLGGAAGGLFLLESGQTPATDAQETLVARQLAPTPQVEIGKMLRENGLATSMIDLSDGLSADLFHICKSSGVGAAIDRSLIPVDPDLAALSLGPDDALDLALSGGEDFQLLFTCPPDDDPRPISPNIKKIGVVTANVGIVQLTDNEKITEIFPKGYRHF